MEKSEQAQVLDMVGAGTIGVDDAVRLLEALRPAGPQAFGFGPGFAAGFGNTGRKRRVRTVRVPGGDGRRRVHKIVVNGDDIDVEDLDDLGDAEVLADDA